MTPVSAPTGGRPLRTDEVLRLRGASVESDEGPVFRGLDLGVARGRVVALIGPNGSGKSTILRALAGTSALAAGTRDAALPAPRIAFLTQSPKEDGALPLSVGEYVAVALLPGRRPWFGGVPSVVREATIRTLHDAGLPVALSRPWAELSGGERQRLRVATILSVEADVVLLDEPESGLDTAARRTLALRIDSAPARRRSAFVIATHASELVDGIADEVVRLPRLSGGPS